MAEFTGERVIPGQVDVDLWNEHLARYAFASRYSVGLRVLDIGCGAGYGTAELARPAAHVIGIDISRDAVRYAREHYGAANLSFLEASCTALPVSDASVDLAVVFEVIEHLEDWRSLLAEIRRVLSPRAQLIISTPNKAYYAESRRVSGPNPYHVHEFEFDEFADELRRLFPHTRFFLQNHTAAIGFHPLDAAPSAEVEFGCAGQSADAHFYVAICSQQPVPPAPAFLYVPSAANVLREREIHIEQLDAQVAELHAEKKTLMEVSSAQKAELDRSNAWAQQLNDSLGAAQARIVALQEELQEKVAWATGLQQQLEAKGRELVECVRLLDTAESTVQERTEWALRLDSELKELQGQLSMIKASRWFRLGRKVGVGPVLPND